MPPIFGETKFTTFSINIVCKTRKCYTLDAKNPTQLVESDAIRDTKVLMNCANESVSLRHSVKQGMLCKTFIVQLHSIFRSFEHTTLFLNYRIILHDGLMVFEPDFVECINQ